MALVDGWLILSTLQRYGFNGLLCGFAALREKPISRQDAKTTRAEWDKERKAHDAEIKEREDLLRKESEGERNVQATKIEALEKAGKDILAANTKLAQPLARKGSTLGRR